MYLALGEKSLGVVIRRQIHDKIKIKYPFLIETIFFLTEIKRNISYKSDFNEWEIIRGTFTHIAFLSNASLWEHAPAGLSK